MNTCSLGCFSKGAIDHTQHLASGVSGMVFALGLKRFGTMWSASKEWTLASQQRGPLLGFGFFGSRNAKTSLPNLFSGFRCSDVMCHFVQRIAVSFHKVFSGGQALKVIDSVVRFVAVDVVNVLARIKAIQPASSHDTMHQTFASKGDVTVFSGNWDIRLELSENFSAARNGVKMVEESINDSVYFYAQHAVPLKVAKES